MKKATIASIVLALIVAANAASVDKISIMKKARRNHLNLNSLLHKNVKREAETCVAVTCVEEGGACSAEDPSQACMDYNSCNDGICGFVEGSKCSYSYCSETLYCNSEEDKCYKKKGEGEACEGRNYYGDCQKGLFCNTTYSTPSVCLPVPQKLGDACGGMNYYQSPCPEGTTCHNSVCKNYPSTVGAACEEDVGCDGESLYCDGTCKEYPKAGEECYDSQYCFAGLYCNDENKCTALPGENEECRIGYPECADDLYCNDESKCVKLPGENEKCLGYECAKDFYCNRADSMCKPLPGPGESCAENGDCKDGSICTVPDDADPYCDSPDYAAPAGAKCFNGNLRCADGLACNRDTDTCAPGECRYDYECKTSTNVPISIIIPFITTFICYFNVFIHIIN